MQVSIFSIIFTSISAIISIGLPIGLFMFCYKKSNINIVPVLMGIAGFIIFVLLLEKSIHSIVLSRFALRERPFMYIIYGVFMAGIFEETARFICFKIVK
ncbi:MAG: YhfC family intramembrane metalloprotease [Treponema sp.]|nr:YhfC family intramembrane metalloprotease [Treponema sp.]